MGRSRQPNTFEEQIKKIRAATVLLARCKVVDSSNGPQLQDIRAVGSGFFISPDGWLLTAKHVANPAANPLQVGEAIIAFTKFSAIAGRFTSAQKIDLDFPDLDVSLIKFSEAFGTVPLSQRIPHQGEEIGVFGYPSSDLKIVNGQFVPEHVTPRAAKTVIGSFECTTKQFLDGTPSGINIINKSFIESQFVFVMGNSGGPVFSAKDGKVLGIVNGCYHLNQGIIPITYQDSDGNGGTVQKSFQAAPFASYSYAISISEVLARLPPQIYSHWW